MTDRRNVAAGDGDPALGVPDPGAAVPAFRVDRAAVDGGVVGIVAFRTAADAVSAALGGAVGLAAIGLEVAAVDGDRPAMGTVAAADAGAPGAAPGRDRSSVHDEGDVIVKGFRSRGSDTGRILTAGGIDGSAVDGDRACHRGSGSADTGLASVGAAAAEKTGLAALAPDGEGIPLRDLESSGHVILCAVAEDQVDVAGHVDPCAAVSEVHISLYHVPAGGHGSCAGGDILICILIQRIVFRVDVFDGVVALPDRIDSQVPGDIGEVLVPSVEGVSFPGGLLRSRRRSAPLHLFFFQGVALAVGERDRISEGSDRHFAFRSLSAVVSGNGDDSRADVHRRHPAVRIDRCDVFIGGRPGDIPDRCVFRENRGSQIGAGSFLQRDRSRIDGYGLDFHKAFHGEGRRYRHIVIRHGKPVAAYYHVAAAAVRDLQAGQPVVLCRGDRQFDGFTRRRAVPAGRHSAMCRISHRHAMVISGHQGRFTSRIRKLHPIAGLVADKEVRRVGCILGAVTVGECPRHLHGDPHLGAAFQGAPDREGLAFPDVCIVLYAVVILIVVDDNQIAELEPALCIVNAGALHSVVSGDGPAGHHQTPVRIVIDICAAAAAVSRIAANGHARYAGAPAPGGIEAAAVFQGMVIREKDSVASHESPVVPAVNTRSVPGGVPGDPESGGSGQDHIVRNIDTAAAAFGIAVIRDGPSFKLGYKQSASGADSIQAGPAGVVRNHSAVHGKPAAFDPDAARCAAGNASGIILAVIEREIAALPDRDDRLLPVSRIGDGVPVQAQVHIPGDVP